MTEENGLCETSTSEESSNEEESVDHPMDDETVKRKLKLIKDKGKRRAQVEIAMNKLYLRKKPTENANSIE